MREACFVCVVAGFWLHLRENSTLAHLEEGLVGGEMTQFACIAIWSPVDLERLYPVHAHRWLFSSGSSSWEHVMIADMLSIVE